MCYPLCIWVHMFSDPDLANLITRAVFFGCLFALVCGLVLGFWSAAGGIAFAVFRVSEGRRRVQKVEVQTLMRTLRPFGWMSLSLLSSQLIAILGWDAGCVC